jgi:hypothetical protein
MIFIMLAISKKIQRVGSLKEGIANSSRAPLKTQWVVSLAYAELRYEGRGCEK